MFAQAIDRVDGSPGPADEVEVVDPQGRFVGRGFYSPDSALAVRILSREPEEPLDGAFFARRLQAAWRVRRDLLGLPDPHTDGYRLVHAEGDGLPGVVVDVYGPTACLQLLTPGMKRREAEVFDQVEALGLPGLESVVEVASDTARRLEGVTAETRVVRGREVEALSFTERGFEYTIPLSRAQKTGHYFDQRENRARVEELAAGRRVLDLCCYTGSFALAAARGDASMVIAADSSKRLVATAGDVATANGFGEAITFRRADVRRDLRSWAEDGEQYDLVVLDPPKLAPSTRHLPRARRTYRGMNRAALGLVAQGGVLVTCSCSAAFEPEDLLRTLAKAGSEAGRELRLLEMRGQAPDHPTPPAFPEGRYLKCAVVEVS